MSNETAITIPAILKVIFLESQDYSVQESNILISVRLISVALFAGIILLGYITYRKTHHKSAIDKIKDITHPHHKHHNPHEVVDNTRKLVIQSPEILISILSVISTLVITLLTQYLNNLNATNPAFNEFNVTVVLISMGVIYLTFVLGPMIYISAKHDWKSFASALIVVFILMLKVVFPYWSFIPLI